MKEQLHKKGGIRHVEKRRTSTCMFADRIATHSLKYYNKVIPKNEIDTIQQTCVATIIAKFNDKDNSEDNFQVMGMAIGIKFINEEKLSMEEKGDSYGTRVRDCHAEILARRAFQRQLSMELLYHLKGTITSFAKYKPI